MNGERARVTSTERTIESILNPNSCHAKTAYFFLSYFCVRWFLLVPSSSRIDKSTTLLALIAPSFLST